MEANVAILLVASFDVLFQRFELITCMAKKLKLRVCFNIIIVPSAVDQ